MLVKTAKAVASQWVSEAAEKFPGFAGAFYHGSTNWLPDDAILPATSDLDIMVVFADPPAVKLGKFLYQGVLLEVSYLPSDQLRSAEVVLGQYHLAGSFHNASVIADPTGMLTQLQVAVAAGYAKRQWVYRRCEDARNRILRNLASIKADDPFHDQVMTWLFATGVTTHVLLVAGLRNPTVRRRYVTVRELLAEYGHLAFHERLLDLLGCAKLERAQVEGHLTALTTVFDVAKTVIKTPFFFASDLNDLSRPIAIEGSQELIEQGLHREAIFWIVATYARCLKVLHHDAPEQYAPFMPGFQRLLADLGILSFADLQQRGEQLQAFLPQLWSVAEAILAANPQIHD
ncbi:MAG: hypothetical protein DYG89_12735 [Caldilinea sp. CFX5]|nr:hypothetical protein [Caldilinea sp. CFX5]